MLIALRNLLGFRVLQDLEILMEVPGIGAESHTASGRVAVSKLKAAIFGGAKTDRGLLDIMVVCTVEKVRRPCVKSPAPGLGGGQQKNSSASADGVSLGSEFHFTGDLGEGRGHREREISVRG